MNSNINFHQSSSNGQNNSNIQANQRKIHYQGRATRGYLQRLVGKRLKFYGIVSAVGFQKKGVQERQLHRSDQYLLIKHVVCPDYRIEMDHVWVAFTPEMKQFNFIKGTNIQFQAKIIEYSKPTHNDFTLAEPENIQTIRRFVFSLN